MGNCIKLQKPVSWVDDEDDYYWESAEHKNSRERQEHKFNNSKEKVDKAGSTEIRIKISKKQLEQILRRVDGEGLQLQRVLEDLAGIDHPQQLLHEQERPWRPRLQAIPE